MKKMMFTVGLLIVATVLLVLSGCKILSFLMGFTWQTLVDPKLP